MEKSFLFLVGFVLALNVSSRALAEVDLAQMPNLSLLQTAAVMEIMQELAKPGNKALVLCGNDILKKAQGGESKHKLTPECRSELNRIITKDMQSNIPEISDLAIKITNRSKTNMDKLQAIHKWVTHNIKYDVETYTDLVKNKKIFENPLQLISPVVTLETKTAVAEGYSLLTAALLRAVNIPAVTIIGIALRDGQPQGPHAWNEAYVENRWINVDTTWDSGGTTGNFEQGLKFVSRPTKKHLDMPDFEFKKSHRAVIDVK